MLSSNLVLGVDLSFALFFLLDALSQAVNVKDKRSAAFPS